MRRGGLRSSGDQQPSGQAPGASPGIEARGWYGSAELGLVLLLALTVRLVDLGFAPFIDEMHHVLAARSLLETGSTAIHEGVPYQRGLVFTYLVAGFFALFGESLLVARIPAVLAGTLLIGLFFFWIRARAGRTAAWTTALLLCFAPIAVYLSQWVRFYSLHALFFWLGVIGTYRLATRPEPWRRKGWVLGGTVLAFLLALSLQVTTVGGLAGLALFLAVIAAPRFVRAFRHRGRAWLLTGAAAAAVLVAIAIAWAFGAVDWLLHRMAAVDVWALGRADNPRYYHWLFGQTYGFLWHLFPFAALVALARHRRLALLLLCIFVVVVGGHSIAAWKAERFVFFVLPAFFGIWGLAVGEALPALGARIRALGPGVNGGPGLVRRGVVVVVLGVALLFAVVSIPGYRYTRQMLLHGDAWSPPPGHLGEQYRGHPDWAGAAPLLEPLVDGAATVIGQPDMKVVYYLGDLDYVLSASYLARATRTGVGETRPEFTVWRKVGRPLVSQPGSIELIMSCNATGLLVAEEHVWGWSGGVPRATADYIEAHAEPVDLPGALKIRAFRWDASEPERSERCDAVNQARREAPIRRLTGVGP